MVLASRFSLPKTVPSVPPNCSECKKAGDWPTVFEPKCFGLIVAVMVVMVVVVAMSQSQGQSHSQSKIQNPHRSRSRNQGEGQSHGQS